MKKIAASVFSVCLVSTAANAFEGQRTFMPPNNLHEQALDGGLTETQFNAVIDRVDAVYAPIIKQFGATLTWDRRWTDETVNASADQPSPTTWQVHMYGGLARRPEVTEDAFTMVICHELGHHLSGFPYVQDWAANEGQADMHATGACAAKMFAANADADLGEAAAAALPDNMKAKCDANHPANERDLCYRALVASKAMADLLAALGNSTVNFDTPDTSVVKRTNNDHPAAQCRLDTYVASALCGSSKWDYKLIPGKSMANHNSMDAQTEAYAHSCADGVGARPTCWFAPVNSNTPAAECPIQDPATCDLLCKLDPSQPWCN